MQQVVNALTVGSIYVMFALGLNLSWGTLNILNLAHGAVFMFAGFSAFLITGQIALPLILLIPVCAVIAGVITVVFDLIVLRPIRRRSNDLQQAELLMLIASIGATGVLTNIARHRTSDSPFSLAPGTFTTSVYNIGSIRITNIQIAIIVLGFLLSAAMALFVKRTRAGRALRALAEDPETTSIMGINPTFYSALTMFIAGALAGIAGVLLIAYLEAMGADTGEHLLVKGFAVIILGGIGSVWGTLLGAMILAGTEALVITYTSGGYTDAVAFAIIIVVIMFRPRGLFAAKKVERV